MRFSFGSFEAQKSGFRLAWPFYLRGRTCRSLRMSQPKMLTQEELRALFSAELSKVDIRSQRTTTR